MPFATIAQTQPYYSTAQCGRHEGYYYIIVYMGVEGVCGDGERVMRNARWSVVKFHIRGAADHRHLYSPSLHACMYGIEWHIVIAIA